MPAIPVNHEQTELEAVVSKQVDKQLKFLREKLIDKFRSIDEIFVKDLGLKPEQDGFTAPPPQPKTEEAIVKAVKKTKPKK